MSIIVHWPGLLLEHAVRNYYLGWPFDAGALGPRVREDDGEKGRFSYAATGAIFDNSTRPGTSRMSATWPSPRIVAPEIASIFR